MPLPSGRGNSGDNTALLLSATIAHDRMVLAGVQNQRNESLSQAAITAEKLERLRALEHLDSNDIKEAAFMFSNVAVTFVDGHKFDDAIRYAKRSIEIAKLNKCRRDSKAWRTGF